MNWTQLHERLIAIARANPPSDAVPYAFEKRIMARLAAAGLPDRWVVWSAALWRAAAACVMIMIVLGAWTYFQSHANLTGETLSADLESTMLAGLDQPGDPW